MEIKMMIILTSLNCIFIILSGFIIKKWKVKMKQQNRAYDNIEILNKDLRAQRHDFLNHLQIIYSLLELDEYEETRIYLNKIYGDTIRLSDNIKTDQIAVNALLQAKSNEASEKEIHFFVNINTKLANISIEEWELCGCIGNLIDNAFDATEEYLDEKCVWIRLYEDMSNYFFEIDNTGVVLKQEEIDTIFNAGVTTKAEEGHGMGLYIVMKTLRKYKGKVVVTAADHGMIFTVSIPKVSIKTL